jgi:hypothetical protein
MRKGQSSIILFFILVFIILIMGSVISGYLNAYWSELQNTRDNQRKNDLNIIRNALNAYFADNNKFPDIGTENGGLNLTGETPLCHPLSCSVKEYLANIPKDPDQMKGCQFFYRHISGVKEYFELYSSLDNPNDIGLGVDQKGYSGTNCSDAVASNCKCKYKITSNL